MPGTERKLTTILAADVVGFSKLMAEDETGTLEALKACRSIVDGVIAEYHGRIFGTAGDSVMVDFQSPVEAVWCAREFQKLIADRSAHPATRLPMQFRVGINLGDVIIEGDNLYGDGVNLAARLEGVAEPSGVCVSSKVYEEVKRKLDLIFADGGLRQLKNIADPIRIYHLRPAGMEGADGAPEPAPAEARAPRSRGQPTVAVHPLRVIGGDEQVSELADGLVQDLLDSLTKQTAIKVLAPQPEGAAAEGGAPEFALEGSIRAAQQRLRLSFTLVDGHDGSQVWSERYDRTLDDVFELQDEISRNVASIVRIRVKAKVFEWLRAADDATLTVPELLDKAAGWFVRSYDDGGHAEAALRLAADQAPGNSMAKAMLAWAVYRRWEFSPLDLPAAAHREIADLADQAVALDPTSYFARLIAALTHQDLLGEFDNALTHAEAALESNPSFTQAQAMRAIAKIHLGEVADGLRLLEDAISANHEDPHRHRHHRELAIGHFRDGDGEAAVRIAGRLVEQAPGLERNRLTLAALLAGGGQIEAARHLVSALLAASPELTVRGARLPRSGDASTDDRLRQGLVDAGLPA